MTVRTYEKMDDISATKSVSDTGGDGDATSLPEVPVRHHSFIQER